jgi:nucleotide-binding universal stress UspA family protein
MYKTIIIPIDMSHMERVEHMVKAARQLGPDAELVLVNAVETIPSHIQAEIPVGLIQENMEHSRKKLEKVAAGISGKTVVEMADGHAASAILDIAEEKKADAIVIASHKPGWQDYLIGSTAARVVRHAKCSVLVVR